MLLLLMKSNQFSQDQGWKMKNFGAKDGLFESETLCFTHSGVFFSDKYDWWERKSWKVPISSFNISAFFWDNPNLGRIKHIFWVNRKKICFNHLLCKAGIGCILDAAASAEKLTSCSSIIQLLPMTKISLLIASD